MDSNEELIDKSVDIKDKTKVKRLPPLVLPLSEGNDFNLDEFKQRLVHFTATSNGFKWSDTNITSKTKKFLSRNGFNTLFWSAMIVDNTIIPFILDLFKDNIKFISDEEFEPTFGMSLNKSTTIYMTQLFVNYFLLFAIPAKSHNQYLQEWVKRKMNAFNETVLRICNKSIGICFRSDDNFDSHPELFLETKRRFYVYKDLVPALTLYAIESNNNRTDIFKYFYQHIISAMKYSGLQTFYMSWSYSNGSDLVEVFKLQTMKDDKQRLISARNVIIDKYGEDMLPFARLLNYPEVEGLDRRHYPDLAFCGHYSMVRNCKSGDNNTMNNFMFRKIQTKTPTDELKRLSHIYNLPGYSEEEIARRYEENMKLFRELGLIP